MAKKELDSEARTITHNAKRENDTVEPYDKDNAVTVASKL